MKRLRNTAIYYIIFGALLTVSFFFFKLWPISILGILLLLFYLILRFGFKKKNIKNNLTKQQLILWDAFLILFPFIYVILFSWYVWRPYNQAIILPKNYEGIVAVQYNIPDGQAKEWTGGFLGIGASRLIKVDSTGMAKSQFTYHNNAIPFLGAQQHSSPKGLKIYYEDDLDNEIKEASFFKWENKQDSVYIYKEGVDFYYPLLLFTVTTPNKYYDYYLTEEEMIERYREKYNREPSKGEFFDTRILRKEFQHYYELQNYHHKK
ncbi:hypothetical protein [Tenacibaculum larymnensis]|uniref:Uncharacterized protein n=1 Tax=Tenacibaculum larymnensis TaxID=2878201 RepID=A0A9X4EMM0_9FLAO|nr:hypothetical protein [Tenacibaculum larymnensis]MDE1206854.1 hypothetical protein [Tenacibaculum larymnensis]